MARELSLVLGIDESIYEIRPLKAVRRVYRLTKVKGEDRTQYDVAVTPYGPECTCPDFVYKREGLDPTGCKHVKALSHFGMV